LIDYAIEKTTEKRGSSFTFVFISSGAAEISFAGRNKSRLAKDGARLARIDRTTNFGSPVSQQITGEKLALGGFSAAVVTLP
jgi:hypothetical protein